MTPRPECSGRDLGEALHARMAVGSVARARLRVVFAPVQQDRAHSCLARGVQFLHHVRQEEHVRRLAIEPVGDQAVAVGIALVAAGGVEVAA